MTTMKSQEDTGPSLSLEEKRAGMVRLFASAPIAQSMGMVAHYDEEGRAVFTQSYHPGFDHALGGVHGGLIATMLDNAGWFTVAPHYENWVATVEFSVRLHAPVSQRGLVATGELQRLGRRMAVARMEVRDEADRLIATGSGTFTDTSVPLRFPD